jgi:hypothetical protein
MLSLQEISIGKKYDLLTLFHKSAVLVELDGGFQQWTNCVIILYGEVELAMLLMFLLSLSLGGIGLTLQ